MPPTRRRSPLALLAASVVAVTVLAGVWLTGGVVSNDYRTSMALSAVWFALTGLVSLLVALRWRSLRIPVLTAFLLTAGTVGTYLAVTTMRDRVVDEEVITAVPAMQPRAGTTMRPGPVELARGRFRSHEHETTGTARVVRAADGRRLLTLTSFSTSAGPDLRVRLVPDRSSDGGADDAIDLGGLKGNRGDQQYTLPPGTTIDAATVVIWCRAFSVAFGSALLRPAG